MFSLGLFGLAFGFVHLFLFLLWWGLVITALVFFVRWLTGLSSPAKASEDEALEILRRRFAKGEITAEEFSSRRRSLEDR
jgi:putative membrane protein